MIANGLIHPVLTCLADCKKDEHTHLHHTNSEVGSFVQLVAL
jgi:hypothetical protein